MLLTAQRRNSLLKIGWQLEWCFLGSKYLAAFAPDLSASTMRKDQAHVYTGCVLLLKKMNSANRLFYQVVYETLHAFEKIIHSKH